MKIKKFLLFCLVFNIILLSSCLETVHQNNSQAINWSAIESTQKAESLSLIKETPVDLILEGTTASELPIPNVEYFGKVTPNGRRMYRTGSTERYETILNEILIEWKEKRLPAILQKSNASELSALKIKLEKGILRLDLKAGNLKDAADADARQVTPPGGTLTAKKAPQDALSVARLLDQRKTILMVILGSVKQAAAQRAAAGG